MLTLPIPEKGPVEAYVSISMRPPGPPSENTTFIVAAVLVCTAITSLVFARTLGTQLHAHVIGGNPVRPSDGENANATQEPGTP